MAQLDGSLEPLRDQALDLEAGVDGLLRSLDQYGLALESDPDQLERIQDRLSVLKRLQRRYGLDLAGLIQRRDELLHRLGSEGFAADLARLQQAETVRRQTRDQANAALRRVRSKAAEALEASLLKLLPPWAWPTCVSRWISPPVIRLSMGRTLFNSCSPPIPANRWHR